MSKINSHIRASGLNQYKYLFPKVQFSGTMMVERMLLGDSTGSQDEYVEYYYLVMDRYGDTIENTPKVEHNLLAVLQLGIQLIDLLEVIHEAGIIHNDIKSANIVCGQNSKSKDKVRRGRLIDFGCASSYLKDDGSHYEDTDKAKRFNGTLIYASYDALCMKMPSRRSEMISLGYYLVNILEDLDFLPNSPNQKK